MVLVVSYQPLARKYRPKSFAELVGQESVARALANAIAMEREPHGVIFTGVRGVGKTTVARLYAKALNCSQRLQTEHGIEPCNTCESCVAIARGNHEDVLEIDGASNTGVNDVRALQETVVYLPQRSAFKVYIIDEVHMLSQAAFNALLKTLEEPPSHVVFVFATTEMHKVPQTIVSRCQAFHLAKLATPRIVARLRQIVECEGISAEERALAVIAREGHGSLRDALTLLDQAIALGAGSVGLEALRGVVVNLSSSPYLNLLTALVQRDAKTALALIDQMDQEGATFLSVVEETAHLARHAFVRQGLGQNAADIAQLGLDDAELAKLESIVVAAAPLDLNRIFRTLVKCRDDLDGSSMDRFIFENYVCEWCFDPGLPELAALLTQTAAATETTTGTAVVNTAATPRQAAPAAVVTPPAAASINAVQSSQLPAGETTLAVSRPGVPGAASAPRPREFPSSWRQLVDAWKQEKPLQARKLEEVHPLEYSAARIVLAVSDQSYASRSLLQRDEQQKIRDQFRELFSFNGMLVIEAKGAEATSAAALPATILHERGIEAEGRRAKLVEDAKQAPFTRDLLTVLGGQLEDVRIADSDRA
ncbi:MAG: DNA polymerase III subunit gamma/tau [Deltaproteobacteria bacterium]|nr:DNA polymerase III subunit gamma/tau [Deltaproteobacteria bacterium]